MANDSVRKCLWSDEPCEYLAAPGSEYCAGHRAEAKNGDRPLTKAESCAWVWAGHRCQKQREPGADLCRFHVGKKRGGQPLPQDTSKKSLVGEPSNLGAPNGDRRPIPSSPPPGPVTASILGHLDAEIGRRQAQVAALQEEIRSLEGARGVLARGVLARGVLAR